MSKYRARHCPKCDYYLGFAISNRLSKAPEVAVANFCLNCNYKLPVHSVVRGVRRPSRSTRRNLLRLIMGKPRAALPGLNSHKQRTNMDTPISPTDYARHLRVIGQDLENLRLAAFNLECTGDSYLVWVRPDAAAASQNPLLRVSRNRLQKLWKNKTRPHTLAQEEGYTNSASQSGKRLRYSAQDLNRMERDRRQLRRDRRATTDGHSLSQLLRTVGEIIGQRGERLLGISWQEFSISMVVETPQGRKEIDVFRPDNLYDIWVRMYLKRENRAISDIPR